MAIALRLTLLLSLATLAACSDGDALSADDTDADRGSNDTDADTGGDTDDPNLDTAPTYWRLDGELTLVGGVVSPEASSISVAFVDDQGRPWQGTSSDPVTCSFAVTSAMDGPAETLEGEPLLGWWQLDLLANDAEDSPCGWTIPQPESTEQGENVPLIVGIGDFDSRLVAPLEGAGFSASVDVYGLYLLHPGADGDVVYVFGIAGTEEQLAGADTTVSTPPLPNGTYQLQTLVLLPVPDAE